MRNDVARNAEGCACTRQSQTSRDTVMNAEETHKHCTPVKTTPGVHIDARLLKMSSRSCGRSCHNRRGGAEAACTTEVKPRTTRSQVEEVRPRNSTKQRPTHPRRSCRHHFGRSGRMLPSRHVIFRVMLATGKAKAFHVAYNPMEFHDSTQTHAKQCSHCKCFQTHCKRLPSSG